MSAKKVEWIGEHSDIWTSKWIEAEELFIKTICGFQQYNMKKDNQNELWIRFLHCILFSNDLNKWGYGIQNKNILQCNPFNALIILAG